MKVFILAALVAVVASQGYPKPQYPKPQYPKPEYPTPAYPAPAYPTPAYKTPAYPAPAYPSPAYAKTPEYAPMPYNFNWAVKDDPSYNDYTHQETADDKGYVTGSYRTLLPDGRTQIVDYKADDYTGYVADVKYDGEAKEYKPAYKPAGYSSPAYPSPAYPSPAYPSPAYPSPAYSAPKYPSPSYPSPAYPSPKYPTKY
ncbi:adhesive plaque matrix protein [Daphnia magna]|uniref:adhesive plaque matrix protein n=1 Tax=Daphnia magna TaxID=35525 RepID=UPI001E1BBFBD|nr:adhesive plaque matrix protein [Daphnia magna]